MLSISTADIFLVAERDVEKIKELLVKSMLLCTSELIGVTFAVADKVVRLTNTEVLGIVVDTLDEFIKIIGVLVFIKVWLLFENKKLTDLIREVFTWCSSE